MSEEDEYFLGVYEYNYILPFQMPMRIPSPRTRGSCIQVIVIHPFYEANIEISRLKEVKISKFASQYHTAFQLRIIPSPTLLGGADKVLSWIQCRLERTGRSCEPHYSWPPAPEV